MHACERCRGRCFTFRQNSELQPPAARSACAAARPPPDDPVAPAAAARVAPELVRTAPRLGSPLAEHQNAGMWGSVETTVKLAFTGLAGFTLACVVIETAGTAVGKTVAGSSESQNYFVTRTLVELLPVWKSTSVSGEDAAVLAPSSDEESASPRHRAGIASTAWRTTR